LDLLDDQASAQFSSRRELRQATSNRTASTSDSERAGRRDRVAVQQSRPVKTSRGVAGVVEPETHRLRRSERAILRRADAVKKRKRRNPISALITMLVVGGMFGLAALPAYASLTADTGAGTAAKTDVSDQSLVVSSSVAALAPTRDGYSATTPEDLAEYNTDAVMAANCEIYVASGAREKGDDYPWACQLSDDQGGWLSPLNYVYRQCVDFVAWRINRDQASYSAPFKWVWSNLTPYGGNGGQWLYNWEALGRTVSNVPVPGAVAYTGGNHVAYVSKVFDDGTVLLEEYNYVPDSYSQRIIPASSVVAFLYPPS
jgi:surface antigen